ASFARWTRSEMDAGPGSSVAGSGAGAGNSGDASSGLGTGLSRSATGKLLPLSFMINPAGWPPVTAPFCFRIQDVLFFSLFPCFRLSAGVAVGDEGGPQNGVAASLTRTGLRQLDGIPWRAQAGLLQLRLQLLVALTHLGGVLQNVELGLAQRLQFGL